MAAKPESSSLENLRTLHVELRAALRDTVEKARHLHAAARVTRREAAEACERSRRLLAQGVQRAKEKAKL